MNIVAQDSGRLIVLMCLGALFAIIGLWLLLKPRPSGGAAKIELFGLKFESSSAGLLVFLIGAVFIVIPLFVPEREALPNRSAKTAPDAASTTPTNENIDTRASGAAALILPAEPNVEEAEPNDRLRASNQLALDSTVSGFTSGSDPDWFVVAVPSPAPRSIEFKIRITGGHCTRATVFNARDEEIGHGAHSCDGAAYLKASSGENDRFYVRVWSGGSGETDYELTATVVSN